MDGFCSTSASSLADNSLPDSTPTLSPRPSPATPPSSVASTSQHARKWSGDGVFSPEALDFLSDFSNYLALGCLCSQEFPATEDDDKFNGWRRSDDPPASLFATNTLYTHFTKLLAAGWIRSELHRTAKAPLLCTWTLRIYILPFDVGHRFVERQSRKLYLALESLTAELDVSQETWQGSVPDTAQKFDPYARQEEGSLFWMFNKLPSPSPSPDALKDRRYAREALEDLLDPASGIPGLRTKLYPYQRRSAGLMLQRETISNLVLDPRLEKRTAPDGSDFYFNPRELVFLREPRYYEACKGGILAETMGLGKTLICLAVILATKDHPPIVPEICSLPPVRSSVAKLSEMAISAINRKSIPWRVELDRVRHATGDMMESVREKLEMHPAHYQLPVVPVRWNRKTIMPPPKKMILASTTLIVVPRNLCKQWQSEIRKHVDEDILRMLVMEDSKKILPPPDELRTFDVVLFTRGRFELELKDGADDQGRRIGATQLSCQCPYIGATRIRDCHCVRLDDLYDSPLKHLHFKRIIIDEGHFFANTNAAAVSVANRLVCADHRWVVSGTPAKDLLGVEVDMSAAHNLWHTPDTKESRDTVLEQRRHFNKTDDTAGAIKSLGALAANFLKIRPWCASEENEMKAEWDECIYRHEDLRKRTFSGFSTSLRRTLQSMVVKTQPEDVESDIGLPPLSHEVIRLEPSFYDKLTANLFTLVLTANAITSERTDVDYLFHKNSQKARSQLISNLRQSAFFWTGFSEADVQASVQSSNGYLEKKATNCSDSDRRLLVETLKCADVILKSKGWRALSRSHEVGLFVEDWPALSADHWAFDKSRNPLLTGVSQLLEAQSHANSQAGLGDPMEGLAGAGVKALAPVWQPRVKTEDEGKAEKPILTKGIPTSSLDGEPLLRRRSGSKAGNSPKKPLQNSKVLKKKEKKRLKRLRIKAKIKAKSGLEHVLDASEESAMSDAPAPDAAIPSLPSDSPLLKSRIVGTTSAKLSYLISQILRYYEGEKILVFYDGDNVAYYIAQMLELLHIKHEIYAKSLPAHLKAEYVVRFNEEPEDRVLLMDVRNAAFGLNLPSASRIFFVNPVCRPNIEAQAIKRAHRIGQTRPVYVETLVLKDTIEDKMLERSRRMTRSEHHDAKALEDDGGIRQIIQSARIMTVYKRERVGAGQMAPLGIPQQVWGRNGWTNFVNMKNVRLDNGGQKRKIEEVDGGKNTHASGPQKKKKAKVRRTLDFVECKAVPIHDSDDEPLANRAQRSSQPQPATKPLLHPAAGTVSFAIPSSLSDTSWYRDKVALPQPQFEPLEEADSTSCTPPIQPSVLSSMKEERVQEPALAAHDIVQDIIRRL